MSSAAPPTAAPWLAAPPLAGVPWASLSSEPRVARRLRIASTVGPRPGGIPRFDPEQHFLETALRSRSARQVRNCLRRMDPVFVTTPRWSQPQAFLEDVALDLAVGEPAIGCRTVGFRALKSSGAGDAWPFMLQLLSQLGRGGTGQDVVTTAADRQGFRAGVAVALEEAHRASRHRLAVLMHGIEHMPVEVLSDLSEEWALYRERHPEGVRIVLLLSGPERPRWLQVQGLHEIELEDYSEAETIAAIVSRCGPLPPRKVQSIARFTGGVPAVVEIVAALVGQRGLKLDADLILHGMGPIADEMRGALDIVSAREELADRLQMLAAGPALIEWLETDAPLLSAGLLKRVRCHGLPQVTLRTPALAALLG